MRLKLLAAAGAALICLTAASASASDLSAWAVPEYNSASKWGLISNGLAAQNMRESITREEFCELMINLYTSSGKTLPGYTEAPFEDTDSRKIAAAYDLGIVSGKSQNRFEPDLPVTREEMARMLINTIRNISDEYLSISIADRKKYSAQYSDFSDISEWAETEMLLCMKYGLINGFSDGRTAPGENAAREQAVSIAARAYSAFVSQYTVYPAPKPRLPQGISEVGEGYPIAWEAMPSARSYNIVIKSSDGTAAVNEVLGKNVSEYRLGSLADGEYTVYVGMELSDVYTYSAPLDIIYSSNLTKEEAEQNTPAADNSAVDTENTAPEATESTVTETPDTDSTPPAKSDGEAAVPAEPSSQSTPSDAQAALTEAEQRVFPNGEYFTSKEEAEAYMTEVCVPVWVLKENGEKASSQKYITVNTGLAEEVVAIFTEIYNDPTQFPIKNVGGFSWRNSASGKVSQHSYGTCIDINWEENYYVRPDGTPITGSFWDPAVSPYSIPGDGIVVSVFAKYGWKWGGNAWGDGYAKDYMHFTFLGK